MNQEPKTPEQKMKDLEIQMKRLADDFEELKINLYEVLQGILGGIDKCYKEGIDLNTGNREETPMPENVLAE